MGNPPEIFDHAPGDFLLCGPLNKQLIGTRFVTDVDAKQTVTSYLLTFDTDFFYDKIQALLPPWDKWRTISVGTV
jgi:hypothetical protein